MPGEDFTGLSSGFTSDQQGANAQLDINMSEDSARNLWDVQAAVQQIAVDFQTAVRAAADFNSYLISIRETSQTVKMPSLGMEGGPGGNLSYAGGRVDAPVLGGAAQSELGMASRISEMEANATGASGGALASRGGGQPTDVGGLINQISNAGWMIDMTGRGHGLPPSQASAVERGMQYDPLDPRATAAISAGRAEASLGLASASRTVAGEVLPASTAFMRGAGLGGFASMAGRIGTVGAVGYAAYQIGDAALQQYAQSRMMGLTTNNSANGLGWGATERFNQSVMAMSPFITSEEAAQIYSNAVDMGWASSRNGFAQGDFNGAVNFMYTAAKDYNMSPQMSASLLQNNALGAGESIQALSEQLLTLKETLDGTGVSVAAANASFVSNTQNFISNGANPGTAAKVAGGLLYAFSGNTVLGPNAAGAGIIQAAMSSQQGMGILGGLTGQIPGATQSGNNLLGSEKAMQQFVHSMAVEYSSMTGMSEDQKAAMFMIAFNGAFGGQYLNQQTATSLMNEAAANPDFILSGNGVYADKSRIRYDTRTPTDLAVTVSHIQGPGAAYAAQQDPQKALDANAFSYRNYSPQVDALLKTAGNNMDKVVLYGPDGKPVMMDGRQVEGGGVTKWFSDVTNQAKFNSGGYYIQDQTGNKYDATNIGAGGSNNAAPAGSNSNNTVYITLSDEAKKWFSTNTDKLNLTTGNNVSGN